MKSSSKSREEAITQIRGILTAKQITRIGTWNVRTAFSTGKLAQVINEMKMQQLKILGISEMRWTGSGKFVSENTTVIYLNGEKHERGVGILFDKTTEKAIINWEPVSDRIITAQLKTRFTNVTIVQVYAPTETAWDAEKDDFYEQLNELISGAPSYDSNGRL